MRSLMLVRIPTAKIASKSLLRLDFVWIEVVLVLAQWLLWLDVVHLLTPNAPPSATCNSTFGPMFDSLPTLHNCFIFPNVTSNNSVTFNDVVPELHYLDPERNATADNVVKRLDECLTRYYETLTHHTYEIPSYYSTLYTLLNESDLDIYWEGYGSGLVNEICACETV